jgi:hypothetical protein
MTDQNAARDVDARPHSYVCGKCRQTVPAPNGACFAAMIAHVADCPGVGRARGLRVIRGGA